MAILSNRLGQLAEAEEVWWHHKAGRVQYSGIAAD
jgi:hypothetical protein